MKHTLIIEIAGSLTEIQDRLATIENDPQITVIFEGESTGKDLQYADSINVVYSTNDALPLYLLNEQGNVIRELSPAETENLMAEAIATRMYYKHAHAGRYGHPVCTPNIPELWRATCHNFGFNPSLDLTLTTDDTQDDSIDTIHFTLKIPQPLHQAIVNTTAKIVTAFESAFPNTKPEDTAAAIFYRYSEVPTAELEEQRLTTVYSTANTPAEETKRQETIQQLTAMVHMRGILEA